MWPFALQSWGFSPWASHGRGNRGKGERGGGTPGKLDHFYTARIRCANMVSLSYDKTTDFQKRFWMKICKEIELKET